MLTCCNVLRHQFPQEGFSHALTALAAKFYCILCFGVKIVDIIHPVIRCRLHRGCPNRCLVVGDLDLIDVGWWVPSDVYHAGVEGCYVD